MVFPRFNQPDFSGGGADIARGIPLWRELQKTVPFDQNNPFFDAFEMDDIGRRANFQGRFAGFGQGQQNRLGNLFEPTFNRYLGALGQQILGGNNPTATFTDYLSQNFNPQRELARGGQRDQSGPSSFYFGR